MDKALINIFKHCILHCSSIGLPIGNDWLSITPEDFSKYCIGSNYLTASAFPSTHYSPSKVENSKHEMKQDLSLSMTPKGGTNPSPPTPNCKWTEEAFCHIVTVVFQKTLDCFLVKVLEEEGYMDVISMLSLSDEDISEIPISISDKHLLFIFRFFHLRRLLNGYSLHDLIYLTQGEFEDFRRSQHCPAIPSLFMETITETLPMPASDALAVKSAQPLLPSSPVKLQAIPMTPLVPAPFHMISATNVSMVIPDSLASATGCPCQHNAPDTSDPPCIDLLGGEMLPSQLNCLPAAQESKKLYPLDSI